MHTSTDTDAGTGLVVTTPFERFYANERDRLVRLLAMDLGDVHLAAEAVDVAMARAWGRWDGLTDQHDAGGWVYRVARNWATSWFRRRRRRSDAPVPETAVHDRPPSHSDHLREHLDALSADHRAVVVLRVLGGCSTEETARRLGIPSGTVQSRLSRALDNLRTMLEDER